MTDHPANDHVVSNPSRAVIPRVRSWLMCGESSVAAIGIALSALVVAVLAACAYWTMHTQAHTIARSRQQQLVTAAEVLAQSAERMLATGELTPVRRLVMDTADRFQIDRMRIALPAGDVIADRDPARITSDLNNALWQKAGLTAQTVDTDGRTINIQIPMSIEGYGSAQLEASAPLLIDPMPFWEAQAGIGAIGVTALLALWLVYRHFRARLAAIGVIRESLLAMYGGEQSEAALAVAGSLGTEAITWNALLDERRENRRKIAVRQTGQRLEDRRSGNSDLSSGCDAMSQGVILLDDKMRVVYSNNAAAVFLGVPREQLVGSPVIDRIRDAELADVVHDAVMHHKRATHVHDRRGAGDSGVIRYNVRPVRESDQATALLVIEDVTQQRVAEEARHQFVAQATHELRSPLTNIRLYLETAIDEGDKDPAMRGKCLNIINQEAMRLERLVGDMLSVAEIESGSIQVLRNDVRMDKLLSNIQAEYAAQAAEKDLKLEFKIPAKLPVVQGDRDKLIIALQNLVANALKYTPDGGQVTVNVEVRDGELAVEVVDTGIGISPEDHLRVFDKFYRAPDKRIDGIAGSGLGLALAREIVRLHGGDINLESEVDHGSTFTITLPIPPHAETQATEQQH